jgi:UDP-2-acetamido-2-deoxy-ribo-hexuluronate aminotransferase
MQIQLRDLKRQYIKLKRKINREISIQMMNTDFIMGKPVEILETKLSDFLSVNHSVSCANGTDALVMVLRAWGVGAGDAVFVPDFTFFATAEAVSLVGATPIFVDVELDTFNISISSLKLAYDITLKKGLVIPKVVIAVDLFGLPADYDNLTDFCRYKRLKLLEDGAQGFGGELHSKKACSFGDAATTSFFPAKPLGCYGDGGAVFTNDDKLAELIKSLRAHGMGSDRYENIRIGYNSRLDTIQARILLVKFDALIKFELKKSNLIASKYNEKLDDRIIKPSISPGYYSSFAQYTIRLSDSKLRDYLKTELSSLGIQSQIYYPIPLHMQAAYKESDTNPVPLLNSIELSNTCLSIPAHPYLTKLEVDYIIKSVNRILERFYSKT